MGRLDTLLGNMIFIRKSAPNIIHVYVDDTLLEMPKSVRFNGRNGPENLFKLSNQELAKLAIGDSLVHIEAFSSEYACADSRIEGKKRGHYIYLRVGEGNLSQR